MPVITGSRYAVVSSTLALVVALGGVGYAAVTIPKNSVGSAQIKNSSVKSTDVKNGSLKSSDFKAGQIPAGPQGPQGPQGVPGTAVAYALISGAGAVTLGKNIATANVNRIGPGSYCISGLSFTPENAVATAQSPAAGGFTVATGIGVGPSFCPAGTQVRAFTKDSGGSIVDATFFLMLN